MAKNPKASVIGCPIHKKPLVATNKVVQIFSTAEQSDYNNTVPVAFCKKCNTYYSLHPYVIKGNLCYTNKKAQKYKVMPGIRLKAETPKAPQNNRLVANNIPFSKLTDSEASTYTRKARNRSYPATIDVVFPDKTHKTVTGKYNTKTKQFIVTAEAYQELSLANKKALDAVPKVITQKRVQEKSKASIKSDVRPKPELSQVIQSGNSAEVINLSDLPPNNRIFVYANKCHCAKCRDKYGVDALVTETVKVRTVSGQVVSIIVLRCTRCGQYYLNYTVFKQYSESYGGLLFEYDLDSIVASMTIQSPGFNKDSILSRCGYNVQSGTPEKYRRQILAYIIDSEKASKAEIIELITGFVQIHKTMHPAACERWRKDLVFVNEYKPGQLTSESPKQLVKAGRIQAEDPRNSKKSFRR